tara:strand:- start:333 stop:689 length:357 start_codon:yes stop_codon:yes gene_type:complete
MEVRNNKREWTGDWSDCYHRRDDETQVNNVQTFASIADYLDHLNDGEADLYWPNFDASPWHLQCKVISNGEVTKLNFWPHKAKAQLDYQKVAEGWDNVNKLIWSIFFANDDEEFDVIE